MLSFRKLVFRALQLYMSVWCEYLRMVDSGSCNRIQSPSHHLWRF